MKSFSLVCLMAASASAVSLESGYKHPFLVADGSEDKEDDRRIYSDDSDYVPVAKVTKKILIVDIAEQSDSSDDDYLEDLIPVDSAKKGVINQIESGFGRIAEQNETIREDLIEEIQDEQDNEIDYIVGRSNAMASDAIIEANGPREAVGATA